ncbi:MAG: hypothetical protein FD123_3654 [Bacteroidetes bacterium]|nr:MAG: hypothetical protein FD123_3654 [Bacteroidota bacterium]
MLRKTVLLFFPLLLLLFPAEATGNFIRLDYSPIMIRAGYSGRLVNGFYENLDFRNGNYFGLNYSIPLTRSSSLSFGLGLTRIGFQKETQGIFPETNTYGLAAVTQRNDYWTFPASFYYSFARRTNGNSGIRLSYVPCVLGGTRAEISLLGGAEQSSFAADYRDDSQPFRHSLLLYITNMLGNRKRSLFLGLDPFIGIGSGFFKSDGVKLNTMSFGISFNLQFNMPRISIDLERKPDPKQIQKQNELKQKQKEIEEQLKNKPKKSRS